MRIFGYTPAQVRKALVGTTALGLTIVAELQEGNLLPTEWTPWIMAGVAIAGSYGIFRVRNQVPYGTDVDGDNPV